MNQSSQLLNINTAPTLWPGVGGERFACVQLDLHTNPINRRGEDGHLKDKRLTLEWRDVSRHHDRKSESTQHGPITHQKEEGRKQEGRDLLLPSAIHLTACSPPSSPLSSFIITHPKPIVILKTSTAVWGPKLTFAQVARSKTVLPSFHHHHPLWASFLS